jgi:hypothetical protein
MVSFRLRGSPKGHKNALGGKPRAFLVWGGSSVILGVVDQPRFSPRKSRGALMRARDYADEASGKSIIATLSANNERWNASIQAEVAAIAEAVSQPARLSTLMPVSLEMVRIGRSRVFMQFKVFQIFLSYIVLWRLSPAGLGFAS